MLALERLNRGHAGIDRVAVIRAPAAVELAVFVLGRPGAQVTAPAFKFRLLVQVAVHQHRGAVCIVGIGLCARHFKKQNGRAAILANDFELEPFHLLCLDPAGRIAQHGVDEPLLLPVGCKHGRLGGNGDVVLELANDVVVPLLADLLQRLSGIQSVGRNACVHGEPPKAWRRIGRR